MIEKYKVQGVRCRLFCTLSILILAILFPALQSEGREVTDAFGRKFVVSSRPQKVYSTSPPMTYLLYAIDPSMLAGLNNAVREHEKKYLRKEMKTLPILGGWFGQSNTPNIEMILKTKPDIVVVQNFGSVFNARVNQALLKSVPGPVVSVELVTVSDYPRSILYLGSLLGREARAKKLAAYAEKTIAEMKSFRARIPEHKKVSVYYAEGVDGLNTECDVSKRSELINLAGGNNVHHCVIRDAYGMEKVSFEQVMLYNPDVILVFEKAFFQSIFNDSRWQRIRAVKNKRVYLIPNQPFNWFDRPPSFMRLLGVKWLANVLYPDYYRGSVVKDSQRFFKLFLSVDLSDKDATSLIQSR